MSAGTRRGSSSSPVGSLVVLKTGTGEQAGQLVVTHRLEGSFQIHGPARFADIGGDRHLIAGLTFTDKASVIIYRLGKEGPVPRQFIEAYRFDLGEFDRILDLAFHEDSQKVVIGTESGLVLLLRLGDHRDESEKGQLVETHRAYRGQPVNGVAFGEKSQQILAGSGSQVRLNALSAPIVGSSGSLVLYEAPEKAEQLLVTYEVSFNDNVQSIAFDQNSGRIFTGLLRSIREHRLPIMDEAEDSLVQVRRVNQTQINIARVDPANGGQRILGGFSGRFTNTVSVALFAPGMGEEANGFVKTHSSALVVNDLLFDAALDSSANRILVGTISGFVRVYYVGDEAN